MDLIRLVTVSAKLQKKNKNRYSFNFSRKYANIVIKFIIARIVRVTKGKRDQACLYFVNVAKTVIEENFI